MSVIAKEIKTVGSQTFNVPNNVEGRTFLRLVEKFINRPRWRFRALGRGSRLEHGCQHSIAQGYAEWLAVYLGGTGGQGGQFKMASQLSYVDSHRLWELHRGAATLVPKCHQLPGLTDKEKEYLQQILETFEESHLESPSEKEENLFYEIFQKLVDI